MFGVDGLADAAEALGEGGAGAGEVEADEAVRVLHEHVPALEQDARTVGEEHGQVLVRREVLAKVHPGEVGRLRDAVSRPRQVLREVLAHEGEVSVEVLLQLAEPGLALFIGRLCAGYAQGVVKVVVPLEPDLAQALVADEDVREHQARHVEGLARGHAGDEAAVVRHDFAERRVRPAAAQQVAVYLVRDDPHVVPLEYLRQALELPGAPDTSAGVVRVAVDEERGLFVGALALEVVPVDGVVPVRVDEVGADVFAAAVVGGVFEIGVGRGQEQHPLVRGADVLHQLEERGDDAVGHDQLPLGELPAVAAAAPGGKGLVIAIFKDPRVAENALVQPLAYAVDDHVRRGELHVRHPHADELLVLVREHHALVRVEDVVAESVRVHGVCVAAVDYLVKIVHGQTSSGSFFAFLSPS